MKRKLAFFLFNLICLLEDMLDDLAFSLVLRLEDIFDGEEV
jgi:hypothetical protein